MAVSDLQRWNELDDPDAINIGQNLHVKAPISERSKEKKVGNYTIEQGDTLYQLSRKFNMSVDDIMELNAMYSPNISIGQVIKVLEK